MRRVVAAVGGLLLAVLAVVSVAPVAAQDAGSALTVREIDATDPASVSVTFTYAGERDDLSDLVVREGGELVDAAAAVPLSDQQALGVVLVIDASLSMQQNALIERVLEAAHAFVDGKSPTDQLAIVTFHREVRLVQDFTTDAAVLNAAIDEIALENDTSLYDGIVRGAALFDDDSALQPNIVVFSDGEDTTSVSTADRARAAVENAGGALFALGVENAGFGSLRQIAQDTGGTAAVAGDAGGVNALFEAVQSTLRKQYTFTYASQAEGGTVPLTLSVGSDQVTAEFVSGSESSGTSTLRPQAVEKPSGPEFLRGSAGLTLGLVLVALALVAALFSVASTFLTRDASLTQTLQPYSEGYVASSEFDEDDLGDGRGQQMATTPFLQRAVEATGQLAERQGLLTKVESLLERANLPLRPAEAIFFYAVGVVLVALVFFALASNAVPALLGAVIVALIPPATLMFLANNRRKRFEGLLPDTLNLLASTLRAGYSLMQGVEAVSQEVSEPMGKELRRVVTEARLGRPLEEALDGISNRMESGDFAWAVMAIRIQREVGGNLAELLVTVADTMTERERLRRDVNALTAEGKISAIVLGILPVGIGLFIYGANPGYLDPLFDETIGKIMLVGSVLLALFGFYWMKKTIEIEI